LEDDCLAFKNQGCSEEKTGIKEQNNKIAFKNNRHKSCVESNGMFSLVLYFLFLSINKT